MAKQPIIEINLDEIGTFKNKCFDAPDLMNNQ